jgi:hypothetical protein
MLKALLALAFLSAAPSTRAEDAATSLAKEAAAGPKTPPLSIEALCARLTPDEVAGIVGKKFVRRPEKDQPSLVCAYGDGTEKGAMPVRTFSLANSRLQEAAWRRFVEVQAKGKVVERDGVLVSHLRRDRFGTDSVWFRDRQGRALELQVNSGVTEAQAVALARAAMD